MPLAVTRLRILPAIAAVLLVLFSQTAWAGRLTPELEAQLKALPQGGTVSVIVEMVTQADPVAAAETAPRRQRLARKRAVRDVLKMVADQDQVAVRSFLGREQASGNVHRVRPFWVFNGLALTANEAVIRRLAARPDVWEIRPDTAIRRPPPVRPAAVPGPSAAVSEWNIAQIRAPEVWALDPSYTGVGSIVGSFDTGVDWSHPDLLPRYRGDHSISWFDPYGEHTEPFDPNGHGTHTTGTAVGGDLSGTNIGVAPGARWIAAKAWNDQGVGLASAFHQIFEWFLAPGGDPDNAPDVVNSSWGFAEAGCITEFRADIQALRAAGIFPAFAAGNDGPDNGSVRSPGAEPDSFATGATDFFDEPAFFSGRGPSPCGGIVKPDISAPGVSILSTLPGGEYFAADGTSMAAPHVSGAVAVLRSINPALTVEQLETILVLGALDLGPPGPDDTFGAGRLDLFQSAQIALGGLDRPIVTIVATTALASEAGPTQGRLTVTRTGSTDEPLTVHYTVRGTATAGSDYVTLPGSVTIAAGSESATIDVMPIDDLRAELDETVVVAVSVDDAYIVGRPGTATVTITSDEPLPDLVIAVLAVPTSVGNLAGFTVSDTTNNQGPGAADGSTTRFYLSFDPTVDPGDIVLGSRAISASAAGGSSTGSTTLTIPPGTPAGTYYFIALADADGVVPEGQEGNNSRAVLIEVRAEVLVAPNAVDLATPPVSFTVTGGGGFANLGFGLPVVNFARNGLLFAQARATTMTDTTLTVPFPTSATAIAPNLPGLAAGPIDVQVYLQTSPLHYRLLAGGLLTVNDTRPAPGVTGVTPDTIDLASPPAAFTVTGGGFVNLGFGLPVVNFVLNGVTVAQARATAMAGSTTLTVPFPTPTTAIAPNLPGLGPGSVTVQVFLQTGPSSYKLLGGTPLTVTDTRPAPGVGAIAPNAIDLADPPPTFTITGGGFANLGFGLPLVNFTRNGVLLAQARATAMTLTTLTVPFPTAATAVAPNLPGLAAGPLIAQVYLQVASSAYRLLGSANLTVADTRPAPGVSGITPHAIDLADPPPSFTITGQGFANLGFGLPVVNFLRNGVALAQARATALTGGTTLTVPFPTSATAIAPNLPGLAAGTLLVQVYLQTAAGSYSLLGSTTLTVTDTRPAPGVSSITPNVITLATPPTNFTITGNGFVNLGFGLPVVNFVRNGVLVAQARATAMTATTLTVPFPTAATAIAPNLPGLAVGAVTVQVYLQQGSNFYSLLGSVALTVQ